MLIMWSVYKIFSIYFFLLLECCSFFSVYGCNEQVKTHVNVNDKMLENKNCEEYETETQCIYILHKYKCDSFSFESKNKSGIKLQDGVVAAGRCLAFDLYINPNKKEDDDLDIKYNDCKKINIKFSKSCNVNQLCFLVSDGCLNLFLRHYDATGKEICISGEVTIGGKEIKFLKDSNIKNILITFLSESLLVKFSTYNNEKLKGIMNIDNNVINFSKNKYVYTMLWNYTNSRLMLQKNDKESNFDGSICINDNDYKFFQLTEYILYDLSSRKDITQISFLSVLLKSYGYDKIEKPEDLIVNEGKLKFNNITGYKCGLKFNNEKKIKTNSIEKKSVSIENYCTSCHRLFVL